MVILLACPNSSSDNDPSTPDGTLFSISIAKDGTGTGIVTSNPAGIDCGTSCTAEFTSGTTISLTAVADTGATFAGWSGACSGTNACQIAMDSDSSVTATFMLSQAGEPLVLVDYGATEDENIYGVAGWNTVTHAGAAYASTGPGGLETTGGGEYHNFQRITGPAIQLEAGDEIEVTWHNATGSYIGEQADSWYPLISFDDANNPDSSDDEPQWFILKDRAKLCNGWDGGAGTIELADGETDTTVYVVTSDLTNPGQSLPTQGEHASINISTNRTDAGIVCDKVVILKADDIRPSKPYNLTLSLDPDFPATAVNLTWTAPPEDVDHYRIYRNGLWINKTYDETEFTDYTAANSTEYTYSVQAYRNPENFSEMSDSQIITTEALAAADCIDPQNDFEYLGAFRFPESVAPNYEWGYRQGGLAHYPNGDPTNIDGDTDYPGSLYSFAHIHYRRVGEISIPTPVIANSVSELPRARQLQDFHDVMPANTPNTSLQGGPGLAYVERHNRFYMTFPDNYNWSGPKLMSHGSFLPDFTDVQGLWLVGDSDTPRDPEYFTYTGYVAEIPEAWASVNTPDMSIITGNTWGNPHLGPSIFALKVPPYDSVTTLPPDSEIELLPLLLYDHRNVTDNPKKLNGYFWINAEIGPDYGFRDMEWIISGAKSAVIMAGNQTFGEFYYGYDDGTIFQVAEHSVPTIPPVGNYARGGRPRFSSGAILFYDPADLAKVAQGILEPSDPQPYGSLLMDEYFIENDITYTDNRIYATAFDKANSLLYVVQKLDDSGSIVHVFRF